MRWHRGWGVAMYTRKVNGDSGERQGRKQNGILAHQHQAGSLRCGTPLLALASCGALKMDGLWFT